MLGADIDIPTLQVMIPPDVDLNDPTKVRIINNIGGEGGIINVPYYVGEDFLVHIRVLIQVVSMGYKVYIACPRLDLIEFLQKILPTENVFTLTSGTPKEEQKLASVDTAKFLVDRQIQVFLTSPSFGTGFSIDAGWVDFTFGFFSMFPTLPHDDIQHLARARKPTAMFVYIDKHTPFACQNMDAVIKEITRQRNFLLKDVVSGEDLDGLYQQWLRFKAIKDSEATIARRHAQGIRLEGLERATRRSASAMVEMVIPFEYEELEVLPEAVKELLTLYRARDTFKLDATQIALLKRKRKHDHVSSIYIFKIPRDSQNIRIPRDSLEHI